MMIELGPKFRISFSWYQQWYDTGKLQYKHRTEVAGWLTTGD